MIIDLDMIQRMWEEDAKIDMDNLHTESTNIPILHAKYFDIYNNISKKYIINSDVINITNEIKKTLQETQTLIQDAVDFLKP